MDKNSSQMCVANTHKGVFPYNTPSFEIAPAPAIFQRRIVFLLKNVLAVQVYLEGILVAKKEDQRMLQAVIQRRRETCYRQFNNKY